MKSKGELVLSSARLVPTSPDANADRGCAEIQPSLWPTAEHKRTALNIKYAKYIQMYFIKDNVFIFWAALF